MDEGGETVFPHAVDKDKVQGDEWSDCAKRGLAVKAKKGDALLFFRYTILLGLRAKQRLAVQANEWDALLLFR